MFKTSRQVIFKKYNYKVYERLFRGSFADIDATLLFFFLSGSHKTCIWGHLVCENTTKPSLQKRHSCQPFHMGRDNSM